MLTEERHDRIRHLLGESGKVVATELADQFQVSEDTIRRDLRELARLGLCRRVYGGALAPDHGPLSTRTTINSSAKANLAAVAAGIIQPGQTVFIDAGSTNIAIAGAIPRDLGLTVITNAPAVALALADHVACRTIVLGGSLDQSKGACLGAQTLREVQKIYADLFVLGTCGLHKEAGITALDPAEAEIKRAMLQQSQSLLLAVTNDKLGTIAPFRLGGAEAITDLVIEADAPAEFTSTFEQVGTAIHRARGPAHP